MTGTETKPQQTIDSAVALARRLQAKYGDTVAIHVHGVVAREDFGDHGITVSVFVRDRSDTETLRRALADLDAPEYGDSLNQRDSVGGRIEGFEVTVFAKASAIEKVATERLAVALVGGGQGREAGAVATDACVATAALAASVFVGLWGAAIARAVSL